jgi:hypothetical protein
MLIWDLGGIGTHTHWSDMSRSHQNIAFKKLDDMSDGTGHSKYFKS